MKNILLKLAIASTITFFSIGCGGGGGDASQEKQNVVFSETQKSFLYGLFKTEYLWASQVPYKNYSTYRSAQEMIDDLRVPLDRWSYYETFENFQNRRAQKTEGFGCRWSYGKLKKVGFNTPCELDGLKRGDILKSINGANVSRDLYYEAESNIGAEVIFRVQRANQDIDIAITPREYAYKSVKTKILTHTSGKKAGHMIFDQFTSAAVDEIEEAFTRFKNEDIDELIIDLRYNDGGSLATAAILLDKIAGFDREGITHTHLRWNQDFSHLDDFYEFEQDSNSLNISRVFFLTTNKTASASEMVINGLKPFMDVIVIGSRTHGKPVGMEGKRDADLIYWLINFSVYNANNIGDYYNGLDVDCSANDNFDFERTDKDGDMFSMALYYIAHNACKTP